MIKIEIILEWERSNSPPKVINVIAMIKHQTLFGASWHLRKKRKLRNSFTESRDLAILLLPNLRTYSHYITK